MAGDAALITLLTAACSDPLVPSSDPLDTRLHTAGHAVTLLDVEP